MEKINLKKIVKNINFTTYRPNLPNHNKVGSKSSYGLPSWHAQPHRSKVVYNIIFLIVTVLYEFRSGIQTQAIWILVSCTSPLI